MWSTRAKLLFVTAAFFSAAPLSIRAADPIPSTLPSPSTEPSPRPLFEQLNRETQSLFKEVAPSIVRVELPTPNAGLVAQDPMAHWLNRLDPESLRRLREMLSHAPQNTFVRIEIHPSSSTQPVTVALDNNPLPGTIQAPHIFLLKVASFIPNSIGVVMDDDQNLIVPHYVDPAAFFDGSIRVQLGDGQMATATFVGSDEKTNLTVLRMHDIPGKPAILASNPLDQGALLLVMSLNPALNRLAVWQGWEPDIAAIVTYDGHIAGFTSDGHFFPASTYSGVANELIKYGQVRRPTIGVALQELGAQDPQRNDPALGNTPALQVQEVLPDYPAIRAGIRKGDLILSVGGQQVGDKYLLAATLAKISGKTEIEIFRD